jgi:membrane protease subunit (stomatin/prohibitin family)
MSLFEGLRQQLRSVIELPSTGPDFLFTLWSDNGDEIKNASKLIVGPGQGCVFVYEGSVRALYAHPGKVDLKTGNIPFWTTISKGMQFFKSEHKVGIYFFRTSLIADQKWGTSSPIKYEDALYRFPVGLRAYGNYSIQIIDPRIFFISMVAGQPVLNTDDFRKIMVNRLIQPLTDYLAEAKLSYTQIDGKREEIAIALSAKLLPEFEKMGFRLDDFRIEGTDFDEATQQRINRIADMAADVQAARQTGLSFKEVQQIEALRDAARNQNGAAGAGIGIGAGIGLGQMMSQAMPPQAPTEATAANGDPLKSKLVELKDLFDANLITGEEYAAKRQALLAKL